VTASHPDLGFVDSDYIYVDKSVSELYSSRSTWVSAVVVTAAKEIVFGGASQLTTRHSLRGPYEVGVNM
jgi:hypothetical protein